MHDSVSQVFPKHYQAMCEITIANGFSMASDIQACSLLRTLAALKPGGKFLELGTGTGLATSWILDGMDDKATLVSIDNDPSVIAVAEKFLRNNSRLSLITIDGEAWFAQNKGSTFDYIFADTWHGKYLLTDEALEMLAPGGIYIVDDMIPQPNWPEGHQEKVDRFLAYLDSRVDLTVTRLCWSTGIVIAVKNAVHRG